jgi:hypothetical protein
VDKKKDSSAHVDHDEIGIASKLLLFLLTLVSFVIQTVVPIGIVLTLPLPDGGICPNEASPLGKLIGLTCCLFFVVLTISMCLSKLRGMGFLKLFCSSSVELLGRYRYFLDLGIVSNIVSMAAAGAAQYLLFIKNAEKDYVILLLQSLAMQFVLTPDEKLMTAPWTAWTKRRLEILMKHDEEKKIRTSGNTGIDDKAFASDEPFFDEQILKKVRLMYLAEASFLFIVSFIGIGWSITVCYCM